MEDLKHIETKYFDTIEEAKAFQSVDSKKNKGQRLYRMKGKSKFCVMVFEYNGDLQGTHKHTVPPIILDDITE